MSFVPECRTFAAHVEQISWIIMKDGVRFFFSFLGLLGALAVHAQVNELPRSTPEAEGVPSKAVTALFDSLMALPGTDIHSVVVLRHGKVIGEIYPAPFAPEYRHTMYSCSKTFVSFFCSETEHIPTFLLSSL